MYCSTCGKPVSPNSRFCSECGSEIGNNQDFEFETDNPEKVKIKKKSPIVRGCLLVIGGFFALIVIVIVIGMLTGPAPKKLTDPVKSPKTATPQSAPAKKKAAPPDPKKIIMASVNKMDSTINKVDILEIEGKYHLNIFLTLKSLWSEESFFLEAGQHLKGIGEDLSKKHSKKISAITFFIHGPTTDKYGNESSSLFMKLDFDMQDLKQINWENMYYQKLLNFVKKADLKPVGRQLANVYCGNPENATDSREFCTLIRR